MKAPFNTIHKYMLVKSKRRGVALMIAISLLGIFALLGMYYVRDSETELKRTALLLDEVRVREYLKTGVNSALVELEKAWQTNTIQELIDRCPLEFTYPFYKQIYMGSDSFSFEPSDTTKVHVKVWIEDESGKININCAPASVLQKILNVNGEVAREIVSSLPTPGMVSSNKWFYLVEELYSSNPIIQEKWNEQILNVVSTWNAGDPNKPIAYLNINKASPDVLVALFNITPDEAQKIINARPIKSPSDLISVLGKSPSSFNIKMDEAMSSTWQFPFTDKSNSFKIIVKAELAKAISGRKYNSVSASRETGIVFMEGNPVVVWNRNIPTEK